MIKLLILNCLIHTPLSVYDLKVFLKQVDADRWGNILIGSIQNAAQTLEKQGAIEVFKIEKTGKRTKKIYSVTAKGRALQKELAGIALASLDIQYSSEFFSGLSTIEAFDLDERKALFEERKVKLLAEVQSIHDGMTEKDKFVEMDKIQKLTTENMIKTIELQIEFVNNLLELSEA